MIIKYLVRYWMSCCFCKEDWRWMRGWLSDGLYGRLGGYKCWIKIGWSNRWICWSNELGGWCWCLKYWNKKGVDREIVFVWGNGCVKGWRSWSVIKKLENGCGGSMVKGWI